MKIVQLASLSAAQKTAVMHLWNQEYPARLAYTALTDFEKYLQTLLHPTHYLLLTERSEVAGWACVFEREAESWFAIILAQAAQGQGYGRQLLQQLKHHQTKLNAWVIDHDLDRKPDGSFYRSPLPFYLRSEFVCKPDIRLETAQLPAVKIEWRQNNP